MVPSPPQSKLSAYFFLFSDDDKIASFHDNLKLMDNYSDSLNVLKKHKPMFKGYKEFLDYCLDDKGEI